MSFLSKSRSAAGIPACVAKHRHDALWILINDEPTRESFPDVKRYSAPTQRVIMIGLASVPVDSSDKRAHKAGNPRIGGDGLPLQPHLAARSQRHAPAPKV